jgi:hypothetical protein
MENQIKTGQTGGESLHFLNHYSKKKIALKKKAPSNSRCMEHELLKSVDLLFAAGGGGCQGTGLCLQPCLG